MRHSGKTFQGACITTMIITSINESCSDRLWLKNLALPDSYCHFADLAVLIEDSRNTAVNYFYNINCHGSYMKQKTYICRDSLLDISAVTDTNICRNGTVGSSNKIHFFMLLVSRIPILTGQFHAVKRMKNPLAIPEERLDKI